MRFARITAVLNFLTSAFALRCHGANSSLFTLPPMTPEEQIRMNELCAGIQEEMNYERFAAMLHEMSELIARKEERRFPHQPKIVWARNKPWTRMSAFAKKLLPSLDGPNRKVEIAIPA